MQLNLFAHSPKNRNRDASFANYRIECTITGAYVGEVRNVRRCDRVKVYHAFHSIKLIKIA